MIKLTSALSGLALVVSSSFMGAGAASPQMPKPAKVAPQITASYGHNLQRQRQAAAVESASGLKKLPDSSASFVKNSKKISIQPRKASKNGAEPFAPSAIAFESFESCTHFSEALPQGWQQQSRGSVPTGEEDHWRGVMKDYCDYFMFTPPADGNMMIAMFYNDDVAKDEWLISPFYSIPAEGEYRLSYYWYTVPYWLYAIDRFHVDFDAGVFIDREVVCNIEVLARAEGDADWTVLLDFEKKFADIEYGRLAEIDYDAMQLETLPLAQFAGKNVQFAFRYFGQGGNTFCLDAVSIDLPTIDAAYMPYFSRLFYGFSPDEDIWWLPASVEFYPVGHPITWYNITESAADFNWTYFDVDDQGNMVPDYSYDPDVLEVTYQPDYTSAATLMNNFYPMPQLNARSPQGGVSSFTDRANFLQAGGTTEFDYGPADGGYTKYTALPFDILTEGFGIHYEGDESLGFFAEPIFGRSVNTDDWWMHYCFPDGHNDDQYAYIDGFANMYFPHETAPMVVRGVSAVAMGTIAPDAEFTANVYTMTPDGELVEKPIATKTITGEDLIAVSSGFTQPYLVLNFEFDTPVIFSTEGTGYAYFVEVCGYHNDKVEYFAPLQSMVPNEHEWCLGFYHIKHSGFDDLTNEMSYVAFFKDDYGRDLYSSFAIGLDAHFPWLMLADNADAPLTIDSDKSTFALHGYYDAAEYTVEAPEWLDIKLAGRYTTTVAVNPLETSDIDRTATLTFTAPGVELSVDIIVKAGYSGIDALEADTSATAPIEYYDLQGHRIAAPTAPGLYLTNAGRKVLIK